MQTSFKVMVVSIMRVWVLGYVSIRILFSSSLLIKVV